MVKHIFNIELSCFLIQSYYNNDDKLNGGFLDNKTICFIIVQTFNLYMTLSNKVSLALLILLKRTIFLVFDSEDPI